MKKTIILLVMTLLLSGCSFFNKKDTSLKESSYHIDNSAEGYLKDTFSWEEISQGSKEFLPFSHQGDMTLYEMYEMFPNGVVSIMEQNTLNPIDEMSFHEFAGSSYYETEKPYMLAFFPYGLQDEMSRDIILNYNHYSGKVETTFKNLLQSKDFYFSGSYSHIGEFFDIESKLSGGTYEATEVRNTIANMIETYGRPDVIKYYIGNSLESRKSYTMIWEQETSAFAISVNDSYKDDSKTTALSITGFVYCSSIDGYNQWKSDWEDQTEEISFEEWTHQ